MIAGIRDECRGRRLPWSPPSALADPRYALIDDPYAAPLVRRWYGTLRGWRIASRSPSRGIPSSIRKANAHGMGLFRLDRSSFDATHKCTGQFVILASGLDARLTALPGRWRAALSTKWTCRGDRVQDRHAERSGRRAGHRTLIVQSTARRSTPHFRRRVLIRRCQRPGVLKVAGIPAGSGCAVRQHHFKC